LNSKTSFDTLKTSFKILYSDFEAGHNNFKQVKTILHDFVAVLGETHGLCESKRKFVGREGIGAKSLGEERGILTFSSFCPVTMA
jgi:hypothetical protein